MRLILTCLLFAVTLAGLPSNAIAQALDKKVYRVGNGVSAPVPIVRTEPGYDASDYARGVHGNVSVSITVDLQGVPHDIYILQSLDPAVDKKVMAAIAKWKFRPGMKNGKPVVVQASLVLQFDAASKGGAKK